MCIRDRVPGVAYGRMIHRHHFHLLAITQKISTHSNRTVSYTHLLNYLNVGDVDAINQVFQQDECFIQFLVQFLHVIARFITLLHLSLIHI